MDFLIIWFRLFNIFADRARLNAQRNCTCQVQTLKWRNVNLPKFNIHVSCSQIQMVSKFEQLNWSVHIFFRMSGPRFQCSFEHHIRRGFLDSYMSSRRGLSFNICPLWNSKKLVGLRPSQLRNPIEGVSKLFMWLSWFRKGKNMVR